MSKLWTPEEDAKLMALWKGVAGSLEARCRQLASHFRGRTANALYHRVSRLARAGKFDRRPGAAATPAAVTCIGCGKPRRLHARGLCRWCYERRKRDGAGLPPPLKATAGVATPRPTRADPLPCPFPPGSEGKVAWLARRVVSGYFLWRRGDAGGEAWDRVAALAAATEVVGEGEG